MEDFSRQKTKTRVAIKFAFSELVFSKRYSDIRMTEVAERANVGRSTVYLHYEDKDAILLDNMAPLLQTLASTISKTEVCNKIDDTVRHFWEHRDRGRIIFFGVTGRKLEVALAAMILEMISTTHGLNNLNPSSVFLANQIAASIFSILRTWLKGDASASTSEIAMRLGCSARALASLAD